MGTATKAGRISLRVTSEQKWLIESAAEAEGRSVTDLAVQAATRYAREALVDRRLFTVPAERWEDFMSALSQPVDHPEALESLLRDTPTLPRRG